MVNMGAKGRLEEALRERLEAAGCYYLREGEAAGAEVWFTPHLNREFIMPHPVADAEAADTVLFQAGLERAFRD